MQRELSAVLTAIGWQGRLNEASTPHEVISVVRDYLALWTPAEIGQLPESCRPGKFVDAEDVSRYAVKLAREQIEGSSAPPALLQKLSGFFTNASLRLSQILARANEVSSEGPP